MRTLFLDRVDSTNEVLKRICNTETAPFLGVLAREQIAGKGRMGRTWWSKKDASFLYSVFLPDSPRGFQVGMVFARSATQSLEEEYGLVSSIKWPNDIYLQGKKLGGVLVEKHSPGLIGGIGLNFGQESFPEELAGLAVSVVLAGCKNYSFSGFLKSFQKNFLNFYSKWEKFPDLFIREEISPRLCWKGKTVRVDFAGSRETLLGEIWEVDQDGFLVLETSQGKRKIMTGDVKLWLQD